MLQVMQKIEKVHLIFKTHLDVGFTDFARNVVNEYFTVFIPKALHTADVLREEGKRFVWTTGSWLIYEYLEKAPPAERKRLEQAIEAGEIVWHGLPCTTHTELFEPSLFRYGLSLSQELDKRFGRKTIAAKMTDVPGHTRAMIPLLVEAGIQFLHIGVNPASTSPDVPPVFVWRDVYSATSAEILVMYHKGTYGDTMIVPGLDEAIAFAHTGDNLGPQSPDEALTAFKEVQHHLPDSTVAASTLDAFATSLLTIRDQLPVITEELGDTWIHGVGTDPVKVAQFRELCRLRRQWLDSGMILPTDQDVARFSRSLFMVGEHTWGMDIKLHLADYEHYNLQDFNAVRHQPNFQKFEQSWVEQRRYITTAIAALGETPLAEEAKRHLAQLTPTRPNLAEYNEITNRDQVFVTADFEIAFDPLDGSICHLTQKSTGRQWADESHRLALFRYQSFSHEDYERFYEQYIINKEQNAFWAKPDYTKPGLESSGVASRVFTLPNNGFYYKETKNTHQFVLRRTVPQGAIGTSGCPHEVVLEVTLVDGDPAVHIQLQWFKKPANRMPEAMWLSFNPLVEWPPAWQMDKMGTLISPLDVITNGNRHLHAVNSGVYYSAQDGNLSIESLDVPLVAPGEPSLLNFNNDQPDLAKGMHFNLYNNIWGTNFPMWFEDDVRLRWTLQFKNGFNKRSGVGL